MAVYEHLVHVAGSGQAQTAHVLDGCDGWSWASSPLLSGATDDSGRLRYTPCSLAAEEMIRREDSMARSEVAGK